MKENTPLIQGCSYKTTWQKNKEVSFVLIAVKDGRVRLRSTGKDQWTDKSTLIMIDNDNNRNKIQEVFNRLIDNSEKL